MASDSSNKQKTGVVKSARRREELRRTLGRPAFELKAFFERRDLLNAIASGLLFVVIASIVVQWSGERPRLAVGQIATATRLNRVSFVVEDAQLTRQRKDEARAVSPRVYVLNHAYLSELEAALLGLPVALESATNIAEVSQPLKDAFDLTEPARLEAVQSFASNGVSTPEWQGWVARLLTAELPANPIIASRDWQVDRLRTTPPVFEPPLSAPVWQAAMELTDEATSEIDRRTRLHRLVERSGFTQPVRPMVVARLMHRPKSTYTFDPQATQTRAEEAVRLVPPITIEHKAGDVLVKRGERLSGDQVELILTEADRWNQTASFGEKWMPRLGLIGIVLGVAVFLTAYLIRFYPRIVRNPLRVVAVFTLMAAMLGVGATLAPNTPFGAVAGATLVAIVIAIAYDQRLAVTVSTLHCVLITLALDQTIGFFAILAAGCGAAIALLPEVRHRSSLVRAASGAAVAAAACAAFVGVLEVPLVEGAWAQIGINAVWAGAAGLVVGFFLLGVLPTVERIFDITTGMTLVELRDTRHPLLRQLQERAPGTYNHSLQVASIAEAAADAIGADSLRVYVGALYHDIGKMNKPDYFVENQSEGLNKHEKLSPAMSLLVIVGHVKDGVELAREYNLPRVLIHFIESHHGTTLVEYFYHAAKSKAQLEGERVQEVEYRYPGPKPRTKEAAILMLADASESASRAMDEPTPASIENLVRKLSRKRLADGQFDDCDLTFRELRTIEDAVIKSIWALYHGRVSYPKGEGEDKPEAKEPTPAEEPEVRPAGHASA